MKHQLTDQQWETFEQAAMECGDVDVTDTYSGRAMYGQHCVGITCAEPTSVVGRLIFELCSQDEFDLAEMFALDGGTIDSMGRESIVYWTTISHDSDDDSDSDSECDDEAVTA